MSFGPRENFPALCSLPSVSTLPELEPSPEGCMHLHQGHRVGLGGWFTARGPWPQVSGTQSALCSSGHQAQWVCSQGVCAGSHKAAIGVSDSLGQNLTSFSFFPRVPSQDSALPEEEEDRMAKFKVSWACHLISQRLDTGCFFFLEGLKRKVGIQAFLCARGFLYLIFSYPWTDVSTDSP